VHHGAARVLLDEDERRAVPTEEAVVVLGQGVRLRQRRGERVVARAEDARGVEALAVGIAGGGVATRLLLPGLERLVDLHADAAAGAVAQERAIHLPPGGEMPAQ